MGKKVNIPSFLIKVNDEIVLKDNMHQNTMVLEARNVAQSRNAVPWMEVNRENFTARVTSLPRREDIQTPRVQRAAHRRTVFEVIRAVRELSRALFARDPLSVFASGLF